MSHVLLFSDMGTGKTIETIWHVQENNLKPCLIICPRSLKYSWYDEIEKWVGVKAIFANTADEVVNKYFHLAEFGLDRRTYYILHHDALAFIEGDEIRELLQSISWRSIVVDECQRFRNLDTYRTRELLKFKLREEDGKIFPKLMFLSGTPIVNSNFDIFYILKMIGLENSPGRFIERYTVGYQTRWGYKVSGSRNTRDLLAKIAPYYIRRTKDEVLKELPEKIETTTRLEMPEDQREIYNHYEEMLCLELDNGETLSSPSVLSLFTRLRQINLDPSIIGKKSSSSKTRAVQDLIDQNPNEKWVVASTSKLFIFQLSKLIKNSLTFTGDDSPLQRHNKLYQFRSNPQNKVLLVTMQTGGLGLNLQVASTIICTDYWWNYAVLVQQIDRLHRIGQRRNVMVYILHNINSIDDFMLEKCKEKEAMASEVIVRQEIIKSIYEKRRGYEYGQQN